MSKSNNDLIVIVGGGPAGFGAALAFNNNNYTNVIVLESRADMNYDVSNSYPVGLNVRGQNSIKELFANSLDFSKFGLRVDQWKVSVGPNITVAEIDSGLSYGTSRSDVTCLLYEEVMRRGGDKIKVLFGHKAVNVDLKSKVLICESKTGEEVRFNPKCLVIADGYRSKVRDLLAEYDQTLKVQQWPWTLKFRVLVSEPEPVTNLNPYVHYIQNSIYISKLFNGRWTTVISIKDKSPEFLSSNDASDKNIDNLKAYLKKYVPQTVDLFTREELKRYFSRSIFHGAVTKVSKLVVDNWAVLLGDAAHSAIPATGEGINSALEDCLVLQNSLKSGDDLQICLENFQDNRLTDVHALSDIAYAAARPNFKNIVQMIFLGTFKYFVGPTKEDYLFGKESKIIKRYSEIVSLWKRQTSFLGGPNTIS